MSAKFNNPMDSAKLEFVRYEDHSTPWPVLALVVNIPHRNEGEMENHSMRMDDGGGMTRAMLVGILRNFAAQIEKGVETPHE